MEGDQRFLRIKNFFRKFYKIWPGSEKDQKAKLLGDNGFPGSYVDFFDGAYDAIYRNPIDKAVDCINTLRKDKINLDQWDIDGRGKKPGEQITELNGFSIGYLKGVYEVMLRERPELFNKRPSTTLGSSER